MGLERKRFFYSLIDGQIVPHGIPVPPSQENLESEKEVVQEISVEENPMTRPNRSWKFLALEAELQEVENLLEQTPDKPGLQFKKLALEGELNNLESSRIRSQQYRDRKRKESEVNLAVEVSQEEPIQEPVPAVQEQEPVQAITINLTDPQIPLDQLVVPNLGIPVDQGIVIPKNCNPVMANLVETAMVIEPFKAIPVPNINEIDPREIVPAHFIRPHKRDKIIEELKKLKLLLASTNDPSEQIYLKEKIRKLEKQLHVLITLQKRRIREREKAWRAKVGPRPVPTPNIPILAQIIPTEETEVPVHPQEEEIAEPNPFPLNHDLNDGNPFFPVGSEAQGDYFVGLDGFRLDEFGMFSRNPIEDPASSFSLGPNMEYPLGPNMEYDYN